MAKRRGSKREVIDTGRNKMFAKRDAKGQFKEMDEVGLIGGGSTAQRQDDGEIGPRRSRRPAASDEEEVATGARKGRHEQIIGTVCPPRC
jgi:hypothetical protein